MKHSRLITVLMLTGLVLGVILGIVIHNDFAGPLTSSSMIVRLGARALYWVQLALGIDPVAKTGQFGFEWLRDLGTLVLIRPLTLMIIPLVFVSVVLGVTSVGDPSRLGLIGGSTLVFYLITMAIAATLGAVIVSTVQPGRLAPEAQHALIARAEADLQSSDVSDKIKSAGKSNRDTMPGAWKDLLEQLVPTNIVREMGEGRTLGVIFFALLLGLGLATGGERCLPAVAMFQSLNLAIMRMVGWVMWAAPLGVFLLVSWTVGRVGLEAMTGPLAKFMFIVIGGLAIQGLVILPIMLVIFGRTNPFQFTWRCRKALLTAFGTASSSATLPVTLETCIDDAGCSRRATNFVVPLGATLNMNGTALFEAVGVVFLCQLYGITLDVSELVIVVITAVLAAIGAAGIPAAGLVTMVIVINAVNAVLQGSSKEMLPASAMGVIVGVDRILDMCRTTLNVWGDMVAAKVITRIAPDEEIGQ
jgi:Na+/H+-dicarboxylate symporter